MRDHVSSRCAFWEAPAEGCVGRCWGSQSLHLLLRCGAVGNTVPGVPAACTSSQLYGTPSSWFLSLGRDARSLVECVWTESQLGTWMNCHAWCCVPVSEAVNVADDPRSLTGNDTVRQQTLVVTAHVNEPLPWRCKPIDGRHHSSNGRLQLEYFSGTRSGLREPTCPESHIHHETLWCRFSTRCENIQETRKLSAWNFGSIARLESQMTDALLGHNIILIPEATVSQSSNHKRRFLRADAVL